MRAPLIHTRVYKQFETAFNPIDCEAALFVQTVHESVNRHPALGEVHLATVAVAHPLIEHQPHHHSPSTLAEHPSQAKPHHVQAFQVVPGYKV